MDYTVYPIIKDELLEDQTFQTKFFDFCRNAYQLKSDPAHVNMWRDDWYRRPETLPFILTKSTKFIEGKGEFFVLEIDGIIEAVSGIYRSEFDGFVAIGGIRSWVNESHRGKFLIGRHLMPYQVEWAKNNGYKTIALTFNEYNKKLINYFVRSGLGIEKKRTERSLFYKGVHVLPYTLNIQHVEQWVIYDKLDIDYEPNWEKVRYDKNI